MQQEQGLSRKALWTPSQAGAYGLKIISVGHLVSDLEDWIVGTGERHSEPQNARAA